MELLGIRRIPMSKIHYEVFRKAAEDTYADVIQTAVAEQSLAIYWESYWSFDSLSGQTRMRSCHRETDPLPSISFRSEIVVYRLLYCTSVEVEELD